MTATPIFSPTATKAALDALTALLNGGTVKIYTGAAPANLGVSATGTLLSSGLTFANPAFAASVDGVTTGIMTATAHAIASDTSAAASGTAGYFRACNSGGTAVAQGTCGTSAADMILNSVTITAGDTVACASYTISAPDGSGDD